jgi:hypothetical protein
LSNQLTKHISLTLNIQQYRQEAIKVVRDILRNSDGNWESFQGREARAVEEALRIRRRHAARYAAINESTIPAGKPHVAPFYGNIDVE